MIEMRNVVAGYGGSPVLKGLDLCVAPGEVVALAGLNGAGKTTTVRILSGQLPADSGSVRVLGMDPWRERREIMSRTGVQLETGGAPLDRTVGEIERILRRLYERWDTATLQRRLARAGAELGSRLSRLSRGQLRQVLLAMVLAPEPEVVILDDVTQGLDPVSRRHVLDELIGDLAERGTTVFLTTHDVDAAARIASRLVVLRRGTAALDIETDELPRTLRRIRFLLPPGDPEILVSQTLGELRVVASRCTDREISALVVTDDDRALADALADTGVDAAEITNVPLEDAVVELLETEEVAS